MTAERVRLLLLPPLPVHRQLAELVVGEEAIGPHPAGIADDDPGASSRQEVGGDG